MLIGSLVAFGVLFLFWMVLPAGRSDAPVVDKTAESAAPHRQAARV